MKKNTVTISYSNSNLWSNLVHTFPSVSFRSILHTLDICFICWYWWGTTTWIINTLASIMEVFMPVIHLRFCNCSVTILLLQHSVSTGDFCSKIQNVIFIHCSSTDSFNGDATSSRWKKQTTAVMPLEAMKWRNYFCDGVMSQAILWDRKFSHSAIPLNHSSKFWELLKMLLCMVANHKIAYVHESWSADNSVELHVLLCLNGSWHLL